MNHLVEFNQLVRTLERDLKRPTTDPLEGFRLSYCSAELTRKLEPLPGRSKVDTAGVAQQKFLEQEALNHETNKRFAPSAPNIGGFPGDVIYVAARLIRKVLGDSPCIDDILRQCAHGPGVTIGCGGDLTSLYFKAVSMPTTTINLLPFARHLVASDDLLFALHGTSVPVPVKRGELFVVPKDNEEDRICEKQPTLNVFLQKGIGSEIRRRLLRRCGINLNDQSINGSLAREGSIHGLTATVDLSNASNSITYGVVRALLPLDWFVLLDLARTRSVVLLDGDTTHDLELFSAMGNGFTFELESLIFWALIKATLSVLQARGEEHDQTVSVYGDDLIFASSLVGHVTDVFRVCGFRVNERKSHVSGPFRESCGSYWYSGFNVKPLRLRKYPRSRLCWIRLANMIYERARDWGEGLYADPTFFEGWNHACRVALALGADFGPLNVDGVLHGYDVTTHNTSYRGRSPFGLIIRRRMLEIGKFVDVIPNVYVQLARIEGSTIEPTGRYVPVGKEPIRRRTRVRRTVAQFLSDDWGVPFPL